MNTPMIKKHIIGLLFFIKIVFPNNAIAFDQNCSHVNERLEKLVCLNSVNNVSDWQQISKPSKKNPNRRYSKWLIPANDYARLNDALFVNTNEYELHWKVLKAAYPDRFPRITHKEYSWLIVRKKPEFNAGTITEKQHQGETVYTFSIWNNTNLKKSRDASYQEVLTNYRYISERFKLRPLFFEANNREQRLMSNTCRNKEFMVYKDKESDYEAYSQQRTFGYIKSLSNDEFEQAQRNSSLNHKDILVLDDAPILLEQPISGTVTSTRQADLSHLNILSIARGTPNCYIKNARKELKKWQNQLVSFSCKKYNWKIAPASLDEAKQGWAKIRPEPVLITASNTQEKNLLSLSNVDTQSETQRHKATTIYGSKGTNLATLYQQISPKLQLKGFLIPAHFYDEFINSQGWNIDLGNGKQWHSFADTIKSWLDDKAFKNSPTERHKRLNALRKAMRKSDVGSELQNSLIEKINTTWGNTTTMLRFRSSSNTEDTLSFSGAGLYDSTSACAEDELDDDKKGPSKCDEDKPKERTLSRALKKVWASLWSTRAYEERDWYGINHQDVSMSVLVNTRSKNEIANMVVFTGDPDTNDDQIIINAQLGHLSVVSDKAGIHPEKIMLKRTPDTFIITDRVHSSEKKNGQIINDETAIIIARHMKHIESVYPLVNNTDKGKVLLDTEWKILENKRLIIKQVRPFVRKL